MDSIAQSPVSFAYGWETITAPARTINPHTAEVTEAWFNYSQWIDRRGHVPEEMYYATREQLFQLAKQAEARVEAWNQEECTCTPISDPCPACLATLRATNGEEIPFAAPIEVTCPDCDGDGTIEVLGSHSLYSSQLNVKTITCDRCNGYGKVEA